MRRGKVRDVYDLGDRLLLVGTDRISAFDCIFPNGIPHKGRVLHTLAVYWFRRTRDIVENHLITDDPTTLLHELTGDPKHLEAARWFDNSAVLEPTIAGNDILEGSPVDDRILGDCGRIDYSNDAGKIVTRLGAQLDLSEAQRLSGSLPDSP